MADGPDLISYLPSEGLTYDTADPKYWDESLLAKEVTRVFEVCHGCRMCFKYCDAFPRLFSAIDDEHEGDVRKVTREQTDAVMDDCFQCKLCEVQCPYTPRDGHEFQLDFPKLVHRYKAVRAREEGRPLRDRMLGNPDGLGKLARMSFGAANAMNRVRAHRWFMEKLGGIHRDKDLPDFASETFERWAHKAGKLSEEAGGEAVLFQTCYVQNNEPQIGRDTIEVMERNRVDLRCVAGLKCCGMPAWESGDLATLRTHAKHNLDVLLPYVEAGAKVLAVNPTCSMMMRREYADLLGSDDKARAERLAEAVQDPSEFLWSLRKEDRFAGEPASRPEGKLAYHAPCHLKAQGVGFKGRDLLRKVLGARPTTVIECCGHDGTYAMKVEGFEPSQRVGKKAFDGMANADATVWSTDCPLAAVQIRQFAGKKPLHPMTLLARAYRGEDLEEDDA